MVSHAGTAGELYHFHPEAVSWPDFLRQIEQQAANRVCVSTAGSKRLGIIGDDDTPGKCRGIRNEHHRMVGFHWSSRDYTDKAGLEITASRHPQDAALDLDSRVWALYEIEPLHGVAGLGGSLSDLQVPLSSAPCRLKRELLCFTPSVKHTNFQSRRSFLCPKHHQQHDDDLEVIKLECQSTWLKEKAASGKAMTWRFWALRGASRGPSTQPVVWTYVWSPNFRERDRTRGKVASREATRTLSETLESHDPQGPSSTASSSTSSSSSRDTGDSTRKRPRVPTEGTATTFPTDQPAQIPTYTMPTERKWDKEYLRPIVQKLSAIYQLEENRPISHTLSTTGVRGPHMEVGNGALGSIQGYQTAARLQDWHSGRHIESMFERLVERVQYHRERLIRSSQNARFVPYLGDITAATVHFHQHDGRQEVACLNDIPIDRGKPRRDVVHILARLAFLTHFLSRIPENATQREELLANARSRIDSDILDVYFGSQHHAIKTPSSVDRVRFWRFLDIEYCDYVAFFASQPKHHIREANQDFAQSVRYIHVLADNESHFAHLGDPLPGSLSMRQFTWIQPDVDAWLSEGFRRMLINE